MPTDKQASVEFLHSEQNECVTVKERELPRTIVNDVQHATTFRDGMSSGDRVCYTSDQNIGGIEDLDGSQQWKHVGRSNSGRRSHRRKIKNSSSHEFVHASGHQIQASQNILESSDCSSAVHVACDGINNHDTALCNNGYPSEVDGTSTFNEQTERSVKKNSLQSDEHRSALPSVSSGSSGLQSFSGTREDKPFSRSQSRFYRGRQAFRSNIDGGVTTARVLTTVPPVVGGSFGNPLANASARALHGRIVRSPSSLQSTNMNISQPSGKRPSHSLPFPSSHYRYNSHATTCRPHPITFRYHASYLTSDNRYGNTDVNDKEPPAVSTSELSLSSTSSVVHSEQKQSVNRQSVNEKKTTWAATVAAATRSDTPVPETNGTCGGEFHATAITFLLNQWRLFCEQQPTS